VQTTVARLIFDSIVPEEFRSDIPEGAPIGTSEIKNILQRVAEERPESYKDISFKLMRLGSKGAVETGSSFSMLDLESPIDKKALMSKVEAEEQKIFSNPKLDQKEKEKQLVKLYFKHSSQMPDLIFDASIKRNSNLAKMVASGARGNKSQLNSNIGSDFLVTDQNNNPVPIGIKSSYTEGMSPAEYFAASYGTRSGLISTKFATQQSGYLAKQLNASALDLMVTEKDCGTST
jgi:DNA-directed RNA polymerase subunit beta'